MAADTIFAVSSGPPPAAIAVIRISGPMAMAAGERIAGRLPAPRRAVLRALRDAGGALLDRALVLCFPGPATATGEDVIELHCHGGRAVVAAVEAALSACDGLRRAEPGEFTRRALTNGRIDLLEAEGLADLLSAETEWQRRAALDGAGGMLSRRVRGWMDELAVAAAAIEVQIDYADDGDSMVETSLARPLAIVDRVRAEMLAELERPSIDRIRDGVRIVVAGPPNTGKSSLVNMLAGWDVAIASPVAGTTRDRLEASVTRSGVAFVLTDTAGLTETDDPVERLGVERAHEARARADMILWTGDEPLSAEASGRRAIHLWTRSDLADRSALHEGALPVSIFDEGSGERIWGAVSHAVAGLEPRAGGMFSDEQRVEIANASHALKIDMKDRDDAIIVSDAVRASRGSLSRLTGENATETMLDTLFARFCLGK